MSSPGDAPMKLMEIYLTLLEGQGFQAWWPGETDFEVCLGAILTQNTAWTNVEKALNNIKSSSLMSPNKLLNAGRGRVTHLIRPSGYFNQKAVYLENFCKFIKRHPISELKKMDITEAKALLLGLKGIGKETADSILLYALGFPIFVVDAYTKRIFSRIGVCKEDISYDELQAIFHNNLLTDVEFFKDYHAQIVMLGKDTCRKKPQCERCILRKNKLCDF
jgi:endonuclease III related protein